MTTTRRGGRSRTPTRSTSDDVLRAVAEREGVDPAAFDDQLYDVVDPDALDALVRSAGGLRRVEFEFRGFRVVVDGDGDVHVRDP